MVAKMGCSPLLAVIMCTKQIVSYSCNYFWYYHPQVVYVAMHEVIQTHCLLSIVIGLTALRNKH